MHTSHCSTSLLSLLSLLLFPSHPLLHHPIPIPSFLLPPFLSLPLPLPPFLSPPPSLPPALLQVMLESDDALSIVKVDLANLVTTAKKEGTNASVREAHRRVKCRMLLCTLILSLVCLLSGLVRPVALAVYCLHSAQPAELPQ